jgi:predicted deacylase
MIINQTEILPGQTTKMDVNMAKLPSHSSIDISITVSRSKKPGPVLLFSGGLHGDEINGTEIVRRILEQNLHIPEIGTTICIPIINVYGFIHFSRYVPDGKDVNRSFPGNKNGSLASRVAYYLMKDIVPQVDYGIDFHTGGASRTNYPQIRCIVDVNSENQLAQAFSAPFTVNSKYRRKSLRYAAKKRGKEILIYEGGESLRFDELAIEEGIQGTLRVMKHLGMIDSAPSPQFKNVVIQESSWIRARYSGILQTTVSYGNVISKGEILGHISDTLGETLYTIRAPSDGYIIAVNYNPVIHQGDAIFHIGRVERKREQ